MENKQPKTKYTDLYGQTPNIGDTIAWNACSHMHTMVVEGFTKTGRPMGTAFWGKHWKTGKPNPTTDCWPRTEFVIISKSTADIVESFNKKYKEKNESKQSN